MEQKCERSNKGIVAKPWYMFKDKHIKKTHINVLIDRHLVIMRGRCVC